eukprot:scaffold291264_cov39-Prasinocladus_malaysianus.AAC.2
MSRRAWLPEPRQVHKAKHTLARVPRRVEGLVVGHHDELVRAWIVGAEAKADVDAPYRAGGDADDGRQHLDEGDVGDGNAVENNLDVPGGRRQAVKGAIDNCRRDEVVVFVEALPADLLVVHRIGPAEVIQRPGLRSALAAAHEEV